MNQPQDALTRQVRALAVTLSTSRPSPLRLGGAHPSALRALSLQVSKLSLSQGVPAMEWLRDNVRAVSESALSLRGGELLPASENLPRIQRLMRMLVADGDELVTADRLTEAVRVFDEIQPLTMRELWRIPEALRVELCAAFESVGRRVVAAQFERAAAEEWVSLGAKISSLRAQRSGAFFERALQLTHEQEMPAAQKALDQYLSHRGEDPEAIIRMEHERQALDKLWISNLMAGFRMLDALNWAKCFDMLCRTERLLQLDPSGIYSKMDEESRDALREEVAAVARATGLTEPTVARRAVDEAQGLEGAQGGVSWWLYDDDGRRALLKALGMPNAPLQKLRPDPSGFLLVFGICVLFMIVLIALAAFLGHILWAVPLIPLAWRFSEILAGSIGARAIKPKPLLRLEIKTVPLDARTLVVVPALLSGEARAKGLAENFEALGALNTDPNIEYLLLGDFPDAAEREMPEDEALTAFMRSRIARMNRHAGYAKYHYLQRVRRYARADKLWRGQERKRGAMLALNQLLLTGEDAQFAAERADAQYLFERAYRYVLTLDADTKALPDAVTRLIGAIAHPLNRPRMEHGVRKGYALIAPRVEQACARNRFAKLMGGGGGLDSYPVAVSNLFMDACGRGVFPGKGIYDVSAFHQAAQKLPDNAILSHDLIEGLLAGTGFACDIAVYDEFPGSLSGYLRRLERWTRGDWQLIRFFGMAPDALGAFMIFSNLIRSLAPSAALMILILSAWTGNPAALLAGVLYAFLPTILFFSLQALRRGVATLALLPAEAVYTASGVCRALYRQFRTGRGLLEWVPAADAEHSDGRNLPLIAGRVCALLLVPALLNPAWALPALCLGAMFLLAPGWMEGLSQSAKSKPLDESQREALMSIARATWRFFETHTPADGPGLPPDNVQVDPPVGKAARTSPTNIGLYLLATVSARSMNLIDEGEMLSRLTRTAETLESIEKWHGHLYNWYDTKTLAPLRPRYVSSVDGGNLAACLLTVSSYVEPIDPEFSARLIELARNMNFAKLYDAARDLFYIGYDAERGALSSGHYDLLASESRILSFAAMALCKVPVRHFARLGRGMAKTRNRAALVSWSGTMFEYLMPRLLMRAPEGSLISDTERAVVAAQKALGEPWGISESGYNAFDLSMNYQYRAFGLPSLSLRGNPFERVVAPYASMLALPIDLNAVLANLKKMQDSGFSGPMGFYEAIDFTPARLPENEPHRVVMSHMAHHQGMILVAIANALEDDVMVRAFSGIPEVRALTLLLSEKPLRGAARRAQAEPEPREARAQQGAHTACAAQSPKDAHLIYGGGTTAFLTAEGIGFARSRGLLLNRWNALSGGDEGIWVHVRIPARKLSFAASGMTDRLRSAQRVRFDAGSVSVMTRTDELELRLTTCVSPEDGALIQRLEMTSHAQTPIQAELTGCFAVALSAQGDMQAHPAFQNLFVQAEWTDNALIFRRKPRNGGEHPMLLYALSGADDLKISFETDLDKLIGREGSLFNGETLSKHFTCAAGPTLNPCAALRVSVMLPPGGRRQLAFIAGIAEDRAALNKMRERHLMPEDARRSLLLAGSQARSMLDFLGLTPARHQLLQRASLLLSFPKRRYGAPAHALNISGLWALGISGDLPLITVIVSSTAQMGIVRGALRAHEFYRTMGVWCDLVLINDYGNDYDQPVRDSIRDALGVSHLSDMVLEPGGAFPLEGASLSPAQRTLIETVSALYFDGSAAFEAALRAELKDAGRHADMPRARLRGGYTLPAEARQNFNGWGGFSKGGYVIDLLPGRPTPAPWCNVLVNAGGFGALVSERGGGFTFYKNSRGGRLTPFTNDPLKEGEGERLTISDGRAYASLLPEQRGLAQPYRVEHRPGVSRFSSGAGTLSWTIDQFVDTVLPIKCLLIHLHNAGGLSRNMRLNASADFLMGVGGDDARLTRVFSEPPLLLAAGAMEGCGFACILTGEGKPPESLTIEPASGLSAGIHLAPGASLELQFLVGWASSRGEAGASIRSWGSGRPRLESAKARWEDLLTRVVPETGDPIADLMLARWLPAQALSGRIWGRVGLYQAGGAYGFRDQLQDMLAIIPIEPSIVRAHLLLCAAHQFEAGDVQHWWHPERTGVRTRISDDLLFLPYVACAYVTETGDASVLSEEVAYLSDIPLPEGADDWYGTPEVSEMRESLHLHCLRAIRRAAGMTGAHGLPLMGAGDWNDGMNRVGDGGGESVWLGQFLKVVAENYRVVCANDDEKEEMSLIASRMTEALESHGWDGEWYRRAYYQDGTPIGSNKSEGGCRIDLIAQCWAAAAALNPDRVKTAMDSAWKQLYDDKNRIIKLLTPPFHDAARDPGYIARYPDGIRENGGQYTHAACWMVMACAMIGDAERAYQALSALMPPSHSDTEEAALKYRVEPYVLAGDVYGEPPFSGRGGWTWYTGAASWLCRAAIKYLLGYDQSGDNVRLNALLRPGRDEAALTIRKGASTYRLVSRRGQAAVKLDGKAVPGDFIRLIDDGQAHEAIFPERKPISVSDAGPVYAKTAAPPTE